MWDFLNLFGWPIIATAAWLWVRYYPSDESPRGRGIPVGFALLLILAAVTFYLLM